MNPDSLFVPINVGQVQQQHFIYIYKYEPFHQKFWTNACVHAQKDPTSDSLNIHQ